MLKKIKKIQSHTIDLKKDGDEAHVFFLSPTDSIENFINRLDSYLPEVMFDKSFIESYNEDIEAGIENEKIEDFAKTFLKKVKKEKGNYPYKNAGELGEIILTIFQKYELSALKVVSKMGNRDSITFNILGRDTSFVYKDSIGDIYMLVGESKLSVNSFIDGKFQQDSLKDGLGDAHDDLKKFFENSDHIKHEIALARKSIRNEMTKENKDIFLEYFIRTNPKHKNLKFKNVIFVGYTYDEYTNFKSGGKSESEYIEDLLLNIQNSFDSYKIKSRKDALDKNSIYFLLPFECAEKARKTFVEHNNLVYE